LHWAPRLVGPALATAVRKLARDGAASKRSIIYAILSLFQKTMAYKPALHACSFSYAYSAIVDSFVKVSFFLEKHYFAQYYR